MKPVKISLTNNKETNARLLARFVAERLRHCDTEIRDGLAAGLIADIIAKMQSAPSGKAVPSIDFRTTSNEDDVKRQLTDISRVFWSAAVVHSVNVFLEHAPALVAIGRVTSDSVTVQSPEYEVTEMHHSRGPDGLLSKTVTTKKRTRRSAQ